MLNYARLSNACALAKRLKIDKIEGSIVECGVWRGGCIGAMARIDSERKIWLFDSFRGLIKPTEKDGERGRLYLEGRLLGRSVEGCIADVGDVENLLFSILNLKKENVFIREGWIEDTIPKWKERVGRIAILRIDLDFYESTKFCLNQLYDNVTDGGYVIIDDYYDWEGCRAAVDEFIDERAIHPNIVQIDYSGCYFKKNLMDA